MAAAPDNVHIYAATLDVIQDSFGRNVLGVAEIDSSGGLLAPWPVRGFDARNAPTLAVATAFVGERLKENFYTYAPPSLRVYATLDATGCGPERDIACGVATFDPATGALATDPAVPGPAKWGVPTQSYRTPMVLPAFPIAMGIAMPASQSRDGGSQHAVRLPGLLLAGPAGGPAPSLSLRHRGGRLAPLQRSGSASEVHAPGPGDRTVVDERGGDGGDHRRVRLRQDLGRFGPVNAVSMLQDESTRTQAGNAAAVGPAGPVGNSTLMGFPDGTAALGLWTDPGSGSTTVVYKSADLPGAVTVWPGFTRDDHWLVSYQGVLPGLSRRRAVLGQGPDGALYLAIQEAAVPSVDGVLPAARLLGDRERSWRSPDLGVHTTEKDGPPGDIGQFLLDVDPCPSTRPNWIPADETVPVYDPTKPPLAHEAVVFSMLAPDAALYPGGALRLVPDADPVLAAEYACLASWFQQPANAGKVLTAFTTNPSSGDYVRGAWVRAGGLVLTGAATGLRWPASDGRPLRPGVGGRDRVDGGGARPGPQGSPLLLPLRLPDQVIHGLPRHGRPDADRTRAWLPGGAPLPAHGTRLRPEHLASGPGRRRRLLHAGRTDGDVPPSRPVPLAGTS